VELTMTQNQNLSEDQERAASEADRLAAIFGPDVLIGLATDQVTPSRRPSSAQQHVRERNQALRQRQREDQAADLAVVAALDQDRQAYDRYQAHPTEQDQHAAYRHAQRHNLVPKRSTVDKLIRQGEQARRVRS
jgi:nucleotide-binding universal stress UspA family protein